jgi:uroporphyrinogen-III synthase
MGLEVIACPLFQLESVTWQAPEPGPYEGLLLTSANAVRHGGPGLEKLKSIAVHAVGAATAAAAVEAGFKVETVGEGDVEDLLGSMPASRRLLHLAGEDHRPLDLPLLDRKIVYRSAAIPDPGLPPLEELVIAIHSPRAGARLAELAGERGRTSIAAISKPAAKAVGDGWERIEVAERPDDSSLLALAAMLCHTSPRK